MTVGLTSFGSDISGPQQACINLSGGADSMFMNFLKNAGSISAGTTLFPGLLSADGYPTSTYKGNPTQISGNFCRYRTLYGAIRFSGIGL